jgi:hypothetical protein
MKIEVDTDKKMIEVDGICYSFQVFKAFLEVGAILRVEGIENKLITVSKLGMDPHFAKKVGV